nr:ebony protein [Gryllus bimaculatus]
MGSIPQLSALRGEVRPGAGAGRRGCALHRLLEERVAAAAGAASAPALLPAVPGAGGRARTFAQLDAAAARLARAMVRRAAPQGPNADGDWLVAVWMAPSLDLVTALLAVWKAGAAYLPLDPEFPAARVAHILGEARPALLLTDSEDPRGVSFAQLQEEAETESGEPLVEEEMLPSSSDDDLALVLYTSGSTGVPKGVRLPQRAVLNRLRWQWRVFPYTESERVCVFKTALTFVDSVCELWGPLLQGRAVLVVPKDITRDPARLLSLLRQHQVERLVLVPSLLRAILMHLESGVPLPTSLKLWVCSGEALSVELGKQFFQYFTPGQHKLCNFYGSTEIMGDVTYHVLSEPEDLDLHVTVPIGLPLDNTNIYLLDDQGRPVPVGEQGQLFVAGSNLALGYVAGRDADRFIDNPFAVDPDYSLLYRTGDYARILKGTIIYEGRTDSQVKIRGHRVDLSEVERILMTNKEINKGVVLCYKPGEIDQALLAFVTVNDKDLTAADIEMELRKNLTSYMVPQVVILETIPLLVNGKTDRQYLLKYYEESLKCDQNILKANLDYSGIPEKKMDAATVLFETVASVLGSAVRSKIQRESNFYELGGNSLNSISTVTQLRRQGFVIGITEFISSKTLFEVLEHMHPEGEIELRCTPTADANKKKYYAEYLSEEHKKDVYSIISGSFYEKADLEQWLMPDIQRSDYVELLDKLWIPLVEKELSFAVKSENGDIVGVAFNFDAYDEPPVEIDSKLNIIFDFLEYLEGPVREEQLPHGKGHILHSFMMGTHENLSYQENIAVMQFMEEEVLNVAKEKNFTGIFTTNTSPLTQQLGIDVYEYKVLNNYQVNKYVAPDGTKPFGAAPDWQTATCCWKVV